EQFVHHVRIAQHLQFGKPLHGRKSYRREAGLLDGFQIPAAAFDVEDVFLLAVAIPLWNFHRSIAAPVQHQRLLAAVQAGGIYAQAEVAGVTRRFLVAPEALHDDSLAWRLRIILSPSPRSADLATPR